MNIKGVVCWDFSNVLPGAKTLSACNVARYQWWRHLQQVRRERWRHVDQHGWPMVEYCGRRAQLHDLMWSTHIKFNSFKVRPIISPSALIIRSAKCPTWYTQLFRRQCTTHQTQTTVWRQFGGIAKQNSRDPSGSPCCAPSDIIIITGTLGSA